MHALAPRLILCLASLVALLVASAGAFAQSAGERLYREGLLPDGRPLVGIRDGGIRIEGAAAACVNCHRPSALGSVEGGVRVPPVLGPYLFRDGETNRQDLALPHVAGFQPRARAYDLREFAEVLRTGHRVEGAELSALMPRYVLGDDAVASLASYLDGLAQRTVPGTTATDVELATVVTPDADPIARDAMLRVLQAYVATQQAAIGARVHGQRTQGEVEYRAARRWHLHVWTLTGPPEGWSRQLEARFAAEPVFALLSGIGGAEWGPVHRFCQRRQVPCLFPNVDQPPVAEQDSYSMYFSRGVALEADLVRHALSGRERPARVVQLFRRGDVGAGGAGALAQGLAGTGVQMVPRPIGPAPATPEARRRDLQRALGDVRPSDLLVLWLRPEDLNELPGRVPTSRVYASGLMGGLETAPLSGAWRTATHLAYPVDLPNQRRMRMNFPQAWLRQHGIPASSPRIETDTYVACSVLDDAMGELLDAYVPDYLLERVESMLSVRLDTGYYPRLGLAPGQRFASKGGYLVQLGAAPGTVVPRSEWLVP